MPPAVLHHITSPHHFYAPVRAGGLVAQLAAHHAWRACSYQHNRRGRRRTAPCTAQRLPQPRGQTGQRYLAVDAQRDALAALRRLPCCAPRHVTGIRGERWRCELPAAKPQNQFARTLTAVSMAGAAMRTAACALLLVCVCGGDGRSPSVGEPAVSGTGPQSQCGPAAQAFDWERARQEYFYLSKVMATDLGGNCAHRIAAEGRAAAAVPVRPLSSPQYVVPGRRLPVPLLHVFGVALRKPAARVQAPDAGLAWLRENDPLVSQNEFCNTDIRSHLKELFTFTLFFAPRTIVRVHRCARLPHLIMHRVPSRGGVLCVCKQA